MLKQNKKFSSCSKDEAFAEIKDKLISLAEGQLAGLGSAFVTTEDNFAMKKLVVGTGAKPLRFLRVLLVSLKISPVLL